MATWLNRNQLARYNPSHSWWVGPPRNGFTATCTREFEDRIRFSEFHLRPLATARHEASTLELYRERKRRDQGLSRVA